MSESQIDAIIARIQEEKKEDTAGLTKDLKKLSSGFSKELQLLVADMAKDYLEYQKKKITKADYTEITDLRKRAFNNFYKGAAEDSLNTALMWIYKFGYYTGKIIWEVFSDWLKAHGFDITKPPKKGRK